MREARFLGMIDQTGCQCESGFPAPNEGNRVYEIPSLRPGLTKSVAKPGSSISSPRRKPRPNLLISRKNL